MASTRMALLLLNSQNDFLRPDGLVHRATRPEVTEAATATALVAAARAGDVPVVWVNTVLRADGVDSALSPRLRAQIDGVPLVEGSWGSGASVTLA